MIKRMMLLVALLISVMGIISAQEELRGTTISHVNVRHAPDGSLINEIYPNTEVIVHARNDVGNWVLVETWDHTIRGWVASRYVTWSADVSLGELPVSTEIMAGGAVAQPPAQEEQPPAEENNTEVETVEVPSIAGVGAPVGQAIPWDAGDPPNGTIIDYLNIRTGPNTTNQVITQLNPGQRVVIESRNQIGNWILVHTPEGLIRGWVATGYVTFDAGLNLNDLLVSSEIVGTTTAVVLNPEEYIRPVPTASRDEMLAKLENTPVLHNFNSETAHNIYVRGVSADNNPRVFMKVGDSLTASQPFLWGYSPARSTPYNLGGYGHLQETINHFLVSPAPGIADSFANEGMAAQTGFTSGAVFDSAWINPNYCDRIPLSCEYLRIKPAVAIVLFGSRDLQMFDAAAFQHNMYQIVEDLTEWGVIPVITTFPSHQDYFFEEGILYNYINLKIAEEYDLPVINLWKATQPLPDNGVLASDRFHLSAGWNNNFDLTDDALQFGVNMRNLLTLQALDELRRNTLR